MAHVGDVFEGKTLDAAVRNGLDALGLSRAEVMITILEEGSGGFLGIGARPYRVRVMRRPGGPPAVEADSEGRRRRHEGRERRERGRGERRGERGAQGGSGAEPGRGPRREERDGGRRRDERGEPRPAEGRGERRRDERRPQAGPSPEPGRRPERGERREERRDDRRDERRPQAGPSSEPGRRPERGERREERPDVRREERPAPLEARRPDAGPAGPEDSQSDSRRRRRRGRRGGRRRHGAPGEPGSETSFATPGEAGVSYQEPADQLEHEGPVERYEEPSERYEEPSERFEEPSEHHEEPSERYEEPSERFEEPSERQPEPAERYEESELARREATREQLRPSRESREREREPRREEGPGLAADELAAQGRRMTEDLLKAMGFEATVSATVDGNHVEVTAEVAKDEDLLTGRKGEVRQALQHLLNRMLNRGESSRYHLQLEINDFWKRREEELRELARSLAEEAVASSGEVVTEYLNAQERRIVHMTLREDARVKTYALGTGMIKRVAIAPADFEGGPRDETD
jgi:spoIIIJ-associated protein